MSTTQQGRTGAPELPSGRIVLDPPPRLQHAEGAGGMALNAIPMLGSVGSIVLVASMGGAATATRFIAAGMFLFATLGFVVIQIDRQRKQRQRQVGGSRREYLHYLAGVRDAARDAARQQRRALTWRHPDPAALPSVAEERSRIWERNAHDPGFLHVRYGVCTQPLALELVPPEARAADDADPAAASALHRLLAVHRHQRDLPSSVDLRAFASVEACGDRSDTRALARALVCQAAAFHAPDQLQIAVLADEASLAHWDWLKWLPHCHSSRTSDAVGPTRMVTTSLEDLVAMLPADLRDRPRFGADDRPAHPHVLLLTDGPELPPGSAALPADGLHGLTVLALRDHRTPMPDPHGLCLGFNGSDGELEVVRPGSNPLTVTADRCSLGTAEAFARRLAPLKPGAGGDSGEEIAGTADYLDLLGLDEVVAYEPATAWRPRPARDLMRVPIGVTESGSPVHLDLKEAAQQGMGPHGLVVGATGSGKSEFLRTLVLGLTLTHSPDDLNLVLVDFKGGATFAGMADLPHVSAVITNLAQELTLVDRMQDALSGEMVRRQEWLREAGNFASVRDYDKARADGADLPPLPALFIVVDEFSELLSAKPEFIDLFVAIGRLGRSLGLHLLLASQRLEEGRLRGLESHLSYRIGLRTFSAQESRAVLGVPDAYELPATPGLGYLKPDPTTLTRFKSAYVSGPPARRRSPAIEDGEPRTILPYTVAPVHTMSETSRHPTPPEPETAAGDDASVLDLAVARMRGQGGPAHRVWLPPLEVSEPLDRLFGDLAVHPDLGLVSEAWRAPGELVVPAGVIDRPREQRRDVLTVDLGGAGGHAGVVGGPRSGKSTLLRTLVTSLALTTTPLETHFFVLDFGGGAFAPLVDLPHVAGVGTRGEPDVVRRIVAEVTGIVDRREEYFRSHGIESVESYRRRRVAGEVDDGYGDVFVVVDGWATLREEYDDVELVLQQLATRGLTFGVHVLASATRWADFRANMRDVFGTRLELRLGDPLDSEVDRRTAELVPTGRPGRGLVASKHHFLGALPRIDTASDAASLDQGLADLVRAVAEAWQGPAGPKLRLLPERVGLADVRATAVADDHRLLLGLEEATLAPVALDVDTEPHLLVFGEGQAGKSALLRCYVHEVMRTRGADRAQLVVVDYRRSLLGEVPEEYLLNYLTSANQAQPALQDLASYLHNRLPGPDVTPEQLRERSWWTGAEVFVVVDDYDLVATGQASPLSVLQPLLAQAADVGLHVVVARRTGGASRALYEPVIQTLRDLAMPGLLLSGSPDEGPLVSNVRSIPAPAGRGQLVTRDGGTEVVQVAWADPTL